MTLPPARRGISVAGARILAEDLRDRVERLDMAAVDGATDLTCPLDLNALVPLPSRLLRLGPDAGYRGLAMGALGHDVDAAGC